MPTTTYLIPNPDRATSACLVASFGNAGALARRCSR